MTCTRGCTLFRKHLKTCPVSDGSNGAWVPFEGSEPERSDLLFVLHNAPETKSAQLNARGELEVWHVCNGCLPRDAKHGSLCESCHVRLEQWLHGYIRYGKWTPSTGSIGWAYDWLSEDRVPTQMMGAFDKIKTGKKAPPAALNLMIHDLRQDMAQALAQWLGMVCQQFGLYGPEWWHARVEEAKRREEDRSRDAYAPYTEMDWRAWLPQSSAEVIDAQRYLSNWLDRIESVPDVAVSIYDTANELIKKVAGVAPWEPKPRRLGREVVCPECERPALAIFEGQTSVTCMRCDAVFGRERYDLWASVIKSEKVAS
jgi:hypothetical protein